MARTVTITLTDAQAIALDYIIEEGRMELDNLFDGTKYMQAAGERALAKWDAACNPAYKRRNK